jgi:small subunit ribosomal protein S27Ae
MQIFVRTASSVIQVEASSMEELRAAVENSYFISGDCLRFTHESVTLESLVDVADGSFLELLVDVDGGMRAKWRKKRMRRLRRKRRKERMRAK